MKRGTTVTLHPASLLLAWMAAAVALQQLTLFGLALAALAIVPLTLILAAARALQMLRRSRWLLLSLALLFAFGTPGRVLPPLPWLTSEGLELAAEHVLRLALLLLLLALLLQRLELPRLMSGLFVLLRPLATFGFDRRKAVSRLMLVIDYVQNAHHRTWRDWLLPAAVIPAPVALVVTPLRAGDFTVMTMLGLLIVIGVLRTQ